MHVKVKTLKAETIDSKSNPGLHPKSRSIDLVLRSEPKGSVSVQNPNISRNKGSGSRIKSGKEISMNGNTDKRRKCSRCNQVAGHNARSCPLNKN